MKYMLLIQQGDAPTPYTPEERGRLSEDEQNAVYAAYKEINETTRHQPRPPAAAPRGGNHCPRAGRTATGRTRHGYRPRRPSP
jgi:hypothetical protein